MIRDILSKYKLGYAKTLIYMLQSTEYDPKAYLRWFWRTKNFRKVMRRRKLQLTKAARLLLSVVRLGITLHIMVSVGLIIYGLKVRIPSFCVYGISLLILYPFVWAHLIVLPLIAGDVLIIKPRQKRLIKQSEAIFAAHPGVKIAIAGSYGKTSMKELLATVLSEGKKVAFTPDNKNTASSHALFASKLSGQEEVLIIEYGEGQPGDVKRFATTTHPNHGIITGLAPAHLDRYSTLQAAGEDIFSLADYLNDQNVYVNTESPAVKNFIKSTYESYSASSSLGWRITDIKISVMGTHFTMTKGKNKLQLKSGLLGVHQVGPLALAAGMALKLGLSKEQVIKGISKTKPYEHRMQARQLHGAWLIDDTYNGNLDGIRAGLELMTKLDAKRKIYITPGLVDQGAEKERVHLEIGKLIAQANPDKVVLMNNSVTKYITKGLRAHGYKRELKIEEDPLSFYTNLDQFVAGGDLILMQNDWTDNYS